MNHKRTILLGRLYGHDIKPIIDGDLSLLATVWYSEKERFMAPVSANGGQPTHTSHVLIVTLILKGNKQTMSKFTGADGSVWNFRFEIPQIVEFMDMLDMCLGDFQQETGFQEKINMLKMSQLIDGLWLLAEETARKRNITKNQFFTEVLKPNIMSVAIEAFYAAFAEAFDSGEPEEEQKGGKKKKGPFVNGEETT